MTFYADKMEYITTIKGITRVLTAGYFLFLLLLSFILVIALSVRGGDGKFIAALGFICYTSVMIVICEGVMALLVDQPLFLKDFFTDNAFIVTIFDISGHFFAAFLFFCYSVAVSVYAGEDFKTILGIEAFFSWVGFIGLLVAGGAFFFYLWKGRGDNSFSLSKPV